MCDGDKPKIAITFDDGYRDNFTAALPVLEEFGVPVTLFIATALIGSQCGFWWDELEYNCSGSAVSPISAVEQQQFNGVCRYGSLADRTNILESMRKRLDVKPELPRQYRILTLAELKLLAQHPLVTIGAHTVNHPRLSTMSRVEQQEEIYSSKKQLEDWVEAEVKGFAYPYGGKDDFNADSEEICRQLGFDYAVANFHNQYYPWTSRFSLPRHVVRNWSARQLAWRMKLFKIL